MEIQFVQVFNSMNEVQPRTLSACYFYMLAIWANVFSDSDPFTVHIKLNTFYVVIENEMKYGSSFSIYVCDSDCSSSVFIIFIVPCSHADVALMNAEMHQIRIPSWRDAMVPIR